MSEKRLAIVHGDLVDKKVLYQIYKSEDGKGYEMYMFYGAESTIPIDVEPAQFKDYEWMVFRAKSFIQSVECKEEKIIGVG